MKYGTPLLLVFYGNPDYMPMIFKEVLQLRRCFRVNILSGGNKPARLVWPEDVEIERFRSVFDGINNAAFSRVTTNLSYVAFVQRLRLVIRDLMPAVIYAHDARAMMATWIANSERTIPVVYRCHDVYEDIHPWHSVQRYIERYAARAGLRAHLVVQYSKGRAEHFRNVAGNPYLNMVVVPNYASSNVQPDSRELDELVVRRFAGKVIVYPGVINRFVAVEDAVKALAVLDQQWSLEVFGTAEAQMLKRATAKAVELGVAHRFSHGGWIPPADALRATNLGMVGLVLFRPISVDYATMATASNKLWEFAARGIPVVVPDTPDYREVLGNEPWVGFFKLGDPVSLAAAINSLTADFELYRQVSWSAYEAVRTRYNFERVFPTVLRRLLEAASPS